MKGYSTKSLKPFVATVLAVALSLPGAALANRRLVNRTVVIVNDDVILESDVAAFRKKLQSKSFVELFGGIDQKILSDRKAILQLLVEEKIINQQVKKLDLQATDQEVEGQIRAILARNGITKAQLAQRLADLGTTMKDYEEGIRRQIERKNLIDREIKPNLQVTDEQLRHYYLRHASAQDRDAEFRIAQILISGGADGAARAEKIYEQLADNAKNFEAAAKEYSDDESTRNNGGELGWFDSGSLSKEFRAVVPGTPIGTVTRPVRTAAGFHIIKVLDVRKDDFKSMPKDKKEALRNKMYGEELEKRMVLWLERKKKDSYIRFSL